MKVYLIGIIFLLSSCSSIQTHTNKQLQDILGVWHLKDFHDDGYSFSQIAYLKGGKKCEISFNFGEYGGTKINYYVNQWKIQNGYLISTVEDSNLAYIPKGDLITDAIHVLTSSELIVLMQPKQEGDDYPYEIERHIKIKGEDPNLICRIVEANLRAHRAGRI